MTERYQRARALGHDIGTVRVTPRGPVDGPGLSTAPAHGARLARAIGHRPTRLDTLVQRAFKDSADEREQAFLQAAQTSYQLSEDNAAELYKLSEGSAPDPVTGLRTSEDKEATRPLADQYAARGGEGNRVLYAKIKFRNLAGLNAVLGHAGADEIFGIMALHVDRGLEVLRHQSFQVRGYRHEGSRFGFMIVGPEGELQKEGVEKVLSGIKADWDRVKHDRKLENIPNPKHENQPGVDLDADVFEITGPRASGAREETVDELANASADPSHGPQQLDPSFQGAAPDIFIGKAESRRRKFFEQGRKLNLEPPEIKALYELAGKASKEPLTGFDQAGDRIETVRMAMDLYKGSMSVSAHYIEVDVRNLGGLNDNLTRADSDNVFRFMAHTTEQYVRSLKADVASFRHGGDEFSFVVVGKVSDIISLDVRKVLDQAQADIAEWVQTKQIRQKTRESFSVEVGSEEDIQQLNDGVLPANLQEAFGKRGVLRSHPVVEQNASQPNELWRLKGSEAYWLISTWGDRFLASHIPRTLTLAQILHSKDSQKKRRSPGTGIVWGVGTVLERDVRATKMSPIDVIARADREVESKKS